MGFRLKLVITILCFFPIIFSGCKNPESKPILQPGKVQINLKTTLDSKDSTGTISKSFVFLTIRDQTGKKILSNFKVQVLREGAWFASIPVSLPAGTYLFDPVIFWDEAESLLLEFSAPPRFSISPNQLITLKSERGSAVRTSLADSLEKILDENFGEASIQLSVKAMNNQTDSLFFVDGTLLKSIDGVPVSLTYLTRETQKILIPQNSKPKTGSFTIKSPDYKDTTLVYTFPENEMLKTRSAEIQLEPINPIRKQLVAWYPFNGNAKDLSGNNYHGKEKQVVFVKDRFGRDEMAAKFEKGSQILIGDVFNEVDIPYTITLWLKTNYHNPRKSDFNMRFQIFETDYSLRPVVMTGFGFHYLNGFVRTGFGNGAGFGYQYRKLVTANRFVGDGKWHFVAAVVKSPKDMNIFIDNKSGYCRYISERFNGKAIRVEHSTAPASIGTNGEGILDDLRFYNYALSEAQIDSLYHEGGWK